jgi:aerobic carbon-monoxide dehydrogenase medium subunit
VRRSIMDTPPKARPPEGGAGREDCMIPGAFAYHRPKSVEEAVSLLAEHGPEARPLAGGHSLIPMMKLRMATPERLIDLGAIAALRGAQVADGRVTIGAMTTQAQVISSAELGAAAPILRETARQIADPQIRARGVVGGNVANGDPGNDMPAVMLCLNADYLAHGPRGERRVSARSFYEAAYTVALADDEILTAIVFDAPPEGHGWAYEKLKRKVGDYATAAAAVVLTVEGGQVATCAIALTNVAPTPLLAEEAAAACVGTRLDQDTLRRSADAAKSITDPATDGRGTAEYRREMAGVMTARALRTALIRAGGL